VGGEGRRRKEKKKKKKQKRRKVKKKIKARERQKIRKNSTAEEHRAATLSSALVALPSSVDVSLSLSLSLSLFSLSLVHQRRGTVTTSLSTVSALTTGVCRKNYRAFPLPHWLGFFRAAGGSMLHENSKTSQRRAETNRLPLPSWRLEALSP
jgi:hypothetical protein